MLQVAKFVPVQEKAVPTGCLADAPKGKMPCPRCGKTAKAVPEKTLAYLLTEQVKALKTDFSGFHFCKTSSCDVIYFRDDTILVQQDLNVTVGCKEHARPATLCYCFGWTKEKIVREIGQTGKTDALEAIRAKMKNQGCSCVTLNPSGSCCLGDVSAAIRELTESVAVSAPLQRDR